MTYLIALIIAIALGAVIALLSFTNIGSGFAGQSEKAQGQVFASAVSQLEIAVSAYTASGGSLGDLTADSADFEGILMGVMPESNGAWLRTNLQIPEPATGDYSLIGDNPTNPSGLILTLTVDESFCETVAEEFSNVDCAVNSLGAEVF